MWDSSLGGSGGSSSTAVWEHAGNTYVYLEASIPEYKPNEVKLMQAGLPAPPLAISLLSLYEA